MKQNPKRSVKKMIVNAFGWLGYLLCFSQWFWVILVYFSVLQSATLLVSPQADTPPPPPDAYSFAPPTPIVAILLVIITLTMVAVTIYAFIRMPAEIAKTSQKTVHKATKAITPVVIKAQHKKDTKKQRAQLTPKIIAALKILLVIIPVILTAASTFLEEQFIDYSIALIVSVCLAGLGTLLFAVQYLTAGILKIKTSELR